MGSRRSTRHCLACSPCSPSSVRPRDPRAEGEDEATLQALPPERRTVGQLVAESIRAYGAHFLRALPLGLVIAIANQLAIDRPTAEAAAVFLAAAPLFTLAFTYATQLVT